MFKSFFQKYPLETRVKKNIRVFVFLFLSGFIILNILACFQAYRFTHYLSADQFVEKKTIPFLDKWDKILFGVKYPKATPTSFPAEFHNTLFLEGNKKIECWEIPVDSAKGTVILYHGYTVDKSSMLERSNFLNSLGYTTFLVDFMGAGGSEGYYTTIGYEEAEQVKMSVEYCSQKTNPNNIILLGTSMGAVAIMKACHDYDLQVKSIILECPFASMRQSVVNRFNQMNLPVFPLADLLVFWGGCINGFNAFSFVPSEYAKSIKIPTLLIGGKNDKKVIKKELDDIYANLKGMKNIVIFSNAGHADYLDTDNETWKIQIKDWLKK